MGVGSGDLGTDGLKSAGSEWLVGIRLGMVHSLGFVDMWVEDQKAQGLVWIRGLWRRVFGG